MTEKNFKKFLSSIDVPADQHDAIYAEANDDSKEFDQSKLLEPAKKKIDALIRPEIEKEARKAGASGAILKSLEAIYNATKTDKSPDFEKWKETVKGKDYAVLIKEQIEEARRSGVSAEEAVKEVTAKLELALKAKEETEKSVETVKSEYEKKLSDKDLNVALRDAFDSFKQKPINPKSYTYFKTDLDADGLEIRMHENKPTLFKKGETIPLQDEKKLNYITLEKRFSDWAEENKTQFKQSGGNRHAIDEPGGGGSGKDKGVVDEKSNTVTYGNNRPIPIEE